MKKSGWKQCLAIWSGKGTITFCVKEKKHEGDHRGTRKQWNQAGERVKITEKMPE